jgi:fatty acid desaturase
MRPRFGADYRTLLWVVLAPGLVGLQFVFPVLIPYVCWLSCYFALALGVIAHNHNHCPTFHNRRANEIFGAWISIFYGYPTFVWIPTHNMNHHKFVNRAGDATITWRYSEKHRLRTAATYFFVSSYWQNEPIKAFIAKARRDNPALFRMIVKQYVVFAGAHLGLLAAAIAIYGWRYGTYVYALTGLLPPLFALWTIMLFNYEQHVHADPWSLHNHSRSWDGRMLNFMLFNNGLHAAHHEMPGLHWSKLRAAHVALVPEIDPRLIQGGMWRYTFRQYGLAPFKPGLGTTQIGRAANDPPDGKPVNRHWVDAEMNAADAKPPATVV